MDALPSLPWSSMSSALPCFRGHSGFFSVHGFQVFLSAEQGSGGENVFYCNLFDLELYLLHLFSGTLVFYVLCTIMHRH